MAKAALALPFAGLHGSLGGTTIVQLPDGPVVRARVYRPRTLTPAQSASAVRLRTVGEAWRALDDGTFRAWQAFARASAWRNPATGAVVVPQAFRLFSGLAIKALQVEPGRSLAGFAPPERAFLGDSPVVECGTGIVEESAGDSTLGDPRSPILRFSADRANAPGVMTEILAQPLVNARRAVYRDKYVAKAFVSFGGPETVEVPLAPGAWAVAYRFVLAATGQETGLVELGVVVVA